MARLRLDRDGAVAILRFDNPPKGYMDSATVEELDRATAELAADDAVRALVFTGAQPGVFIRHYDVAELAALSKRLRAQGRTFDPARPVPERLLDRVFDRLAAMPKPAIAAINGHAMGGGFEFAMACDLRYAERGAFSLGQPEINIGILAGAGGTQRLARLVGLPRAMELNLTGRTVSPDEAAAIGMVNAAVDAPVLAQALAVARRIASRPPQAVAHIKRLVRAAGATALADGLALERTLFLDLAVREDASALMDAMVAGDRDIRDM